MTNLYELALRFVVEHVGDLLAENFLPTGSRVDAHHGHSDGPRRVSDRHLEVDRRRLLVGKISFWGVC